MTQLDYYLMGLDIDSRNAWLDQAAYEAAQDARAEAEAEARADKVASDPRW